MVNESGGVHWHEQSVSRVARESLNGHAGCVVWFTGLSGSGKSTLITERNAKAFLVLDREIESGKKKFGIFYGAGHLKDMHKRLVEDYGMQPTKTEWLDAWDLK